MKKLVSIDERTGEIDPEGFPAWITPRIKSQFGQEWFMASQEALLELATEKDFSGETFRVFFYMAAHLDFENYIRISQKDIANDLNLRNTHVSRAVRKLKEKSLLVEGKESGRSKTYRLNPHFGWKGKSKHHKNAMENVIPFPEKDDAR